MELSIFKKKYSEDTPVGWQIIDEHLRKIYSQEPRHYGPLCGLHYIAGGTDPLDGASIYDSNKQLFHHHLVSFGMSELYYDEEKVGGDYSKWGFEFTMRLAPYSGDEKRDPLWFIEMMNNLARYVFQSGNWFEPFHVVPAKGPILIGADTEITSLVFVEDPELGTISTPYGALTFLQIVGITTAEQEALGSTPTVGQVEELVNRLKENNPLLITDLNRK